MPEDDAPVTKGDLKEMMAEVLEQANNNTKRLLDDKLPEPKSNKRRKLEKIKLNSKAKGGRRPDNMLSNISTNIG